ncbi:MAG: sulfotransferase [Acidimicrobiales bacterium]
MLIITGMHRSGTSLVAQLLRELGADFGPDELLWEADRWNVNGYLERREVVDFNSRLLTGFNRTTSRVAATLSQASYLRMPKPAVLDKRADKCAEKLQLIRQRVDGLAVKDPRFCLTIRHWQRVAPVVGVVVVIRHPSASVASLVARNKIPSNLGFRFWTWHMIELLKSLTDDAVVVRHADLLGPNPAAVIDRLAPMASLVGSGRVAGDALSLLDPTLVHHAVDDSQVPIEARRVWEQWLDRC